MTTLSIHASSPMYNHGLRVDLIVEMESKSLCFCGNWSRWDVMTPLLELNLPRVDVDLRECMGTVLGVESDTSPE